MISTSTQARTILPARSPSHAGFSMIELMVAMTVFLIIGGAAMSLFRSHADLFTTQQGEVGLNMSLRNALGQIQTDASQAGNGFYISGATSQANTPIGITITNNAGAFDSMYLLQTAANASTFTSCIDTTTGTGTVTPGPGVTAASLSGLALFMNGNGNQMTLAQLTSAAVNGANINITWNPTGAGGVNSGSSNNPPANDPFGLTWNAIPIPAPPAPPPPDTLTNQFCQANGDYVVPLSYVRYYVNGNNQLVRATPSNLLNPDIIADQIIGFKIGAATYQSGGGTTSTPAYSFTAANQPTATPAGYSNQFTLIRSIRVSLIGRTPPGQFTGSAFRNSFDGGQYRIQALSLVINPRNLSMND
jgi:prepilin-type N-terminal cleavage/methylation domain-containing protein